MSAAATAAGYLYASGRLRGRSAREQDHNNEQHRSEQKKAAPPRDEVRVAVLPPQDEKPRRTPKIEYRRRRWSAA